jgi:ferredoxin
MRSCSLVLNPIACDGHGICAELLPEMIELDDWGYPIISPSPVPRHLEALARRAVAACPTLALALRKANPDPAERPPPARRGMRARPN